MAVELSLTLRAYRDAVADAIQEGVPELRDVKVHIGSFGVETVNRFSDVSPAARISFLGMRNINRNNVGQLVGPCMMAVFIATKDPYQNEAYGPALDLAERVADFLDMNTFGLSYCAAAEVTDIEPIYSEAMDKTGSAIVTITFKQEVTIGRSRHEVDEQAFYPEFDDELLRAGWPDNVQGNASSNLGVPNVFANELGPPEDLIETGPHPEEEEQI
jgi:hypothetical protein